MQRKTKILKENILLDNREISTPKRNFKTEKKRTIIWSGLVSALLILLIYYTLPYTILSLSGLFVYASVVSLVIFLIVLLLRYFTILFMSYFFFNKYTYDKNEKYTPFVSIIIPVYNEGLTVKNSIQSLLELDYPNYEIIIVNDGSTDNTEEVVKEYVGYHANTHDDVKISLINKPNGGKAKALNAGIQYSNADFFLCMDGDSQLTKRSLLKGMRHFSNPAIGAVAGNVKVLNRRKFITDLQSLEYIEGLNLARSAQGLVKMINIIPGPIGFFRREAVKDVGFYSSDTYAEDSDITLKLIAKGWKISYEPEAISYTEAPAKIQQLLTQRYRWTRGILQAIRKHKKFIINPTINFNKTLILWVMFYESLVWPAMNIFANLFFISVALVYGMSNLLFFWWIGIAILDMAAALYCIAAEKEDYRLLPYAIVYRLVYILIIDITKAMATIEEFLGIRMKWGRLKRTGYSSQ